MSNARRFAFVSFDSVDDAKTAVKSMTGKALDGREIRVDFAEERGLGELCEDFQRFILCVVYQKHTTKHCRRRL